MIRFLLDLYSTDILALGDRFTKRVDFYHIADYLKIDLVDDEYVLSVQAIFGELLTHYRTLIEQATDDTFLIYDLSDQYVAAFHLEKFQRQTLLANNLKVYDRHPRLRYKQRL